MNKIQKILLWASLAFTLVCGLMIPCVRVNSDMTRYLPERSQMKQGLDIMSSEFDASALSVPEIRIMTHGMDREQLLEAQRYMEGLPQVEAVAVQENGEGYSLFELTVPKTLDQKTFAYGLKERYEQFEAVVQTAQDGNTPNPLALILAVASLVVILLIMSKSWIDPLLILTSTGMAVAINVGTNAFLPSVSITTNSIVGVLQLMLSIDYSVILINRYRQERAGVNGEGGYEPPVAMQHAIRGVRSSLISSALTTVVGLLMLMFMKLKIGLDLGGVLAKGVVCSLLMTYTALPGLVVLCDRAVTRVVKKVPVFGTDRLSRWIFKLRVPLTVLFVVVFTGSFIGQRRTPIHFTTNVPTPIDKVFPRKNAIVLIYDNADSAGVCAATDSAANAAGASVLSYPTLLQRSFTSNGMCDYLDNLLSSEYVAGMIPPGTGPVKLDFQFGPASLRTCMDALYRYARPERAPETAISFPEMIAFVKSFNIPELSSKLAILDDVMSSLEEQPQTEKPVAPQHQTVSPVASEPQPVIPVAPEPAIPSDTLAGTAPEADTIAIAVAPVLPVSKFADTVAINTAMDVDRLSAFMGSGRSQVKLVFSMAGKLKEMTPLQFSRFLVNDLFHRKSLSGFVTAQQKTEMTTVLRIMEEAMAPDEVMIVGENGSVAEAAYQIPAPTVQLVEEPPISALPPATESVEEDPRLDILGRMKDKRRRYTAAQMSSNLSQLGENIPEDAVRMLYALYAACKSGVGSAPSDIRMTLEEVVNYAADTLIYSPALDLIPSDKLSAEEMRAKVTDIRCQLTSGLGKMRGEKHSIAAIISSLPDEAPETEEFIKSLRESSSRYLPHGYNMVGESVMFLEMKEGFSREILVVTLLTIIAIFLIVTITFRSVFIAALLVMTVMSGVFVNVCVSGIGGGSMLYLANLIVQGILMGATIDYGILFINNYKYALRAQDSASPDKFLAIQTAYRSSINTIMTSGMILVIVPGLMAMFIDDAMISPIVSALSAGALSAMIMIVFVLPGVLAVLPAIKKKNKVNL